MLVSLTGKAFLCYSWKTTSLQKPKLKESYDFPQKRHENIEYKGHRSGSVRLSNGQGVMRINFILHTYINTKL